MGADFAQWVAGNSGIPDSASHHLFSRRVGSRGCGGAVSRAKREPPLLRVERTGLDGLAGYRLKSMTWPRVSLRR
jgi:hypothetical protein